MTNLTEQWKKGELPEGEEYWVILTDEWYLQNPVKPVRAFYSCDCEFEGYLDDDIKEVLAPVPSYEEWEQLKEELKDYEYQHKQDGICYNDLFCKLELARKENRQLKKFLKKAINLVMESNWENHAHYKESIQLRDETNNLLNDSPSPTDLKQG